MTTSTSPTESPSTVYTRVSYPGELGAPLVHVAYDVPLGWNTDPLPGALAVSREPVMGPNGFWANVVTSIDRVGPSTTLDHVITDIFVTARDGAVELDLVRDQVRDVSGTPAVLREQRLQVTTTDIPLVQFVLVLLVDVGDGVARDCVQITGTVEQARRDEFAERFLHLVSSVELDL
ncbi:MAG: hypothetical protein Q7T55_00040 [Solirubrobacteraceae bacterium]|nr:hypothetical protein [Solirubrobacteraceae bacterium]